MARDGSSRVWGTLCALRAALCAIHMIAVVTGTSGFIGSQLVDALRWRGWTVRRLLRAGTPAAAAAATATPAAGTPRMAPLGALETHVVDLARPDALAASGALDDATVVFHVGGVTKAQTDEAFRAGNDAPTRALLDALAARGVRPRRFVLVSSQAAAGPATAADRPVTEDDPPQPFEAYGRSKLEAETVVREHGSGVPWTIVRPGAVYGPGDRDFLPVFQQVAHGVGVYPGRRDARLSIVYLDDLVDALIRVGATPAAAERTYFVATESVSWRDVYRAVSRAARRPLDIELDVPRWILEAAGQAGDVLARLTGRTMLVNAHKVALGGPRWWLCDATRAREELGFTSRVALSDGMKRTFEWYKAKGWL